MKFLINKISQEDINAFGSDGYLEADSGDFYSYQVEFGTNPGGLDEVAISDGCDRYIPVAIENVPGIIAALREAYTMHKEMTSAELMKADVESDLVAYVDTQEIEYTA